MRKLTSRPVALGAALIVIVIAGILILPAPSYEYQSHDLPDNFNAYYESLLKESAAKNAKPKNEERLIRFAEKTPIAILYIHGFGASRGEGEYITDRLANKYRANTFYLRLPGHGTDMEDHRKATYQDYLQYTDDAIRMMPKLGDKIVVIGTSMGGLLATYVASRHPDKVDALVLASPFYDFEDPMGFIPSLPGGISLMEVVLGGDVRNTERRDEEGNVPKGYAEYWYLKQYVSPIRDLALLKDYVATDATFRSIEQPVLMFYYYKDEEHKDPSASVSAMLEGFSLMNNHPQSRAVAIEEGNHVLLSEWVESDKERIEQELNRFMDQTVATPAQ